MAKKALSPDLGKGGMMVVKDNVVINQSFCTKLKKLLHVKKLPPAWLRVRRVDLSSLFSYSSSCIGNSALILHCFEMHMTVHQY